MTKPLTQGSCTSQFWKKLSFSSIPCTTYLGYPPNIKEQKKKLITKIKDFLDIKIRTKTSEPVSLVIHNF